VIFIVFTLSLNIWISQSNEGKVTTLCKNSNHLMPRKYHKGRDFILKIICKTKYKCIKEQYHDNKNYKYENVTMGCVYIYNSTITKSTFLYFINIELWLYTSYWDQTLNLVFVSFSKIFKKTKINKSFKNQMCL